MLSGKLLEKHIRTRSHQGITLSYIEGWHAVDEANRVFGFEGWDRETLWAERVWEDGRTEPRACSYAARVRIRVRAGDIVVSRDGSGVGHGTGATSGEAHESALKEAETDATNRALTTFGNLFGLALYDKAQNGVPPATETRRVDGRLHMDADLRQWKPPGQIPRSTVVLRCDARCDRQGQTPDDLDKLWTRNTGAVDHFAPSVRS